MEQFSAGTIYRIAVGFEQLRSNCNLFERFGKVQFLGSETESDEMKSIELLASREIRKIGPDSKEAFIAFLKLVENHGSEIGLDLAVTAARDYLADVKNGAISSYTDMERSLVALDRVITLQLQNNVFMVVPSERASFFSQAELFGEKINRRFPRCQYDVEEAGSCYAAGRGTAVCVSSHAGYGSNRSRSWYFARYSSDKREGLAQHS